MLGSDVATEFGWIPPNGLRGDSVTDRLTDDGRTENNAALAHPYHEVKWCSKFGWIPPSGLGGGSVTDTVELQWLEPRWLVYHGWVEHILESAGISSKYDIRII